MLAWRLGRQLVGRTRRTWILPAAVRPLATTSGGSSGAGTPPLDGLGPLVPVRADGDDAEEALFSPENVKGLSPVEVARMRVVYGFVREHVDVVERMLPPVDPTANPLIDPRSFEALKTLPKLPTAALRQFREDVPAEDAASARALSTRSAWDPAVDGASASQNVESAAERAALVGPGDASGLWAAVDERTMDPHYLLRMRRQSMRTGAGGGGGLARRGGPGGDGGSAAAAAIAEGGRARAGAGERRCRLSGRRGRVAVDFREVALLGEFVNEHGKLMARRKTALSAKAQRKVSRAVKTARQMALMDPEPRPGLSLAEMREMERALQAAG